MSPTTAQTSAREDYQEMNYTPSGWKPSQPSTRVQCVQICLELCLADEGGSTLQDAVLWTYSVSQLQTRHLSSPTSVTPCTMYSLQDSPQEEQEHLNEIHQCLQDRLILRIKVEAQALQRDAPFKLPCAWNQQISTWRSDRCWRIGLANALLLEIRQMLEDWLGKRSLAIAAGNSGTQVNEYGNAAGPGPSGQLVHHWREVPEVLLA